MTDNLLEWIRFAYVFGGCLGGWVLVAVFAREIWEKLQR